MSQGKWKVTSNFINGRMMYAVYRLKDVNAVDHSGNREYAKNGYTADEKTAEEIAKNWNSLEEK